jgi:hypothetical protein
MVRCPASASSPVYGPSMWPLVDLSRSGGMIPSSIRFRAGANAF